MDKNGINIARSPPCAHDKDLCDEGLLAVVIFVWPSGVLPTLVICKVE
jgi:hypothetical protein